MNQDIKTRIDSIKNKDAIRLYFALAKELFTNLELTEDNEKIAFNVRNDSQKKISLTLNSRLVLSINNKSEFSFMLKDVDLISTLSSIEIIDVSEFQGENPKAKYALISYETLLLNLDKVKAAWISGCKEYEPTQEKSQYRQHHIRELYELAINADALGGYISSLTNNVSAFEKIINALRIQLKAEENELSNFEIVKLSGGSGWAWVRDSFKIIGDKIAHYEIIEINHKIRIDIQFEGSQKEKDIFRNEIKKLPDFLSWINWRKSKSIRHVNEMELTDPEVVSKICATLLEMERGIGSKIREIKLSINSMSKVSNSPLNQILYGPPGTGKTFHTINKSVSILSPAYDLKQNRNAIKEKFEELVKEGQIIFTTFHQSMSYEDFIEGIKPVEPGPNDTFLKYEIQDGIFKQICKKATSNLEYSKTNNSGKLSFEEAFERLREDWEQNPQMPFQLKTVGYDFIITGISQRSIQFKKASGGTGHSLSINTLREIYYGREFNFKQGIGIYYSSVLEKLYTYINEDRIKPELKKFVLIIDEINRGNVSQIFGELITLIEVDKRIDKPEALEVILPYSKEKFGVPSNLYIIGTMNTADRSVEALDAALRRRFSFEEMEPNPNLLSTRRRIWEMWWKFPDINWNDDIYKEFHEPLYELHGIQKDFDSSEDVWKRMWKEGKNENQIDYLVDLNPNGIDLEKLLSIINTRIAKLLDKDHQIGHSYFMKVNSVTDLKMSFQNEIIPLLKEYFYGDHGKIGLVIGSGFIIYSKSESFKEIFADFRLDDYEDLSLKTTFTILSPISMSDEEFNNAILKLIN